MIDSLDNSLFDKIYSLNSHRIENSEYYSEYLKKYVKYFLDCKSVLVLDSTYGTFNNLLKEKNINSLGVDTSQYFYDISKDNFDNIEFAENYNTFLNKNENKFDGVFLPYIFEKNKGVDALKFIFSLQNSLKKNSVVVVLSHNYNNQKIQEDIFWRNLENKRPYPEDIMFLMLRETGFQLQEHFLSEDNHDYCFVLKYKGEVYPKEISLDQKIYSTLNDIMEGFPQGPYPNKEHFKQYTQYFASFSKVLEIGCGDGQFLEILKEFNIEEIGIDTNYNKIDECKNKGLNAVNIDYDLFLVDKENEFDGIFSSHLIEHLDTRESIKFLYYCSKSLKKDGNLVIVTPNYLFPPVNESIFWKDLTHARPYFVQVIEEVSKFFGLTLINKELTAENLDVYIALQKNHDFLLDKNNFKNQEEFFNEIFSIVSHKYEGDYDSRYNYQRNYYKFLDICSNVLVIPSQDGAFMETLQENEIETEGVESFKGSYNMAIEKGFNVSFDNCLNFISNKKEEYEGIFSPYLLDHIESHDVVKFLMYCYEALVPNGNIVLVFPNFTHPGVRSGLFWIDLSHTRPYSLETIENIMVNIGFRIISRGVDAGGLDNYIVAYKSTVRNVN